MRHVTTLHYFINKGGSMPSTTYQPVQIAAIEKIKIISESVRIAKEIPSGTLYALVCGKFSINDYNATIEILERANLISNESNLLKWIGPEICD